MKKFLAILMVIAMVTCMLAACGGNSAPKDSGAEAPKKNQAYKVALVILSGDHGFTGESVKHAELEAKAMEEKYDNLTVVVKSCGEAADQISEIENLIATDKPDAIMLWPTEGEALRSAAQTVVDANIKLVVYDRLIENFDGLTGQMMGDNESIGKEMGEYLNEYYKDYADVQYLRFVGDSSTVTSQRSGGMDNVLDGKFQQVDETYVTDWSSEKAQDQMENWLAGHTKEDIEAIDLIVTHDDEIVDGLMNALEAYTGDADLSNLKLITSVGGRKQTLDKFDNTTLDVKFVTWFFAPSFIRECVDFTCENAMGVPFSGTAAEVAGIYLIPSFSIGNAGNTDQTFDSYRASEIFATRYSIDG